MARHHRVVHLKQRPFDCQCGKSFATQEQRDHHYVSKHTDKKPYVCERGCTKAFASPNARIYHYKMHHDKEKFNCPLAGCSHTFTSQKHLRNHMLKPHNDSAAVLASEISKKTLSIETLKKEIEMLKQGNMQLGSLVTHESALPSDLICFPIEDEEPEDCFKFLFD